MQAQPNPTPTLQVTEADLKNLPSYGLLMDRMDRNELPLSGRQYRRAAAQAAVLVAAFTDNHALRSECMKSESLRELLSNQLTARAAALGTIKWLWTPKA